MRGVVDMGGSGLLKHESCVEHPSFPQTGCFTYLAMRGCIAMWTPDYGTEGYWFESSRVYCLGLRIGAVWVLSWPALGSVPGRSPEGRLFSSRVNGHSAGFCVAEASELRLCVFAQIKVCAPRGMAPSVLGLAVGSICQDLVRRRAFDLHPRPSLATGFGAGCGGWCGAQACKPQMLAAVASRLSFVRCEASFRAQ